MRVDGGITANNLCMQIQADVMGIEVIRPQNTETTALGAAYSAGLALDFWKDTDEIRAHSKTSTSWSPKSTAESRSHGYARWQKAVDRSIDWVI